MDNIEAIKYFFLGVANEDKFTPPDKDIANIIDESFRDDSPDVFFEDLYNELVEISGREDLEEEDYKEFLIELGMITMKYVKYKIEQAKK